MPQTSASNALTGDRTTHDRFNPPPHDRRRPREPIGFHVTVRLEDDRPIATTPAALRVVARVVLEQGEGRGLLAFGAADDHLHAALATDRATAGAFARYVESALVWRLGLGARFERARIRPLHDQKHAYNTFHYVHRQETRHALVFDRAREGTSLPDLLGLRVLETSLIARVRAHLPRIRREHLVAHLPPNALDPGAPRKLGLDVDPSASSKLALDPFASSKLTLPPKLALPPKLTLPPTLDALDALDLLADAAAAALALPDLRGRSLDAARARRAAVHAAGPSVPSDRLAESLRLGSRAVQRLRNEPGEPLLIAAVQRQAALHCATLRAPTPESRT